MFTPARALPVTESQKNGVGDVGAQREHAAEDGDSEPFDPAGASGRSQPRYRRTIAPLPAGRLMEARLGKKGKREYVQTLRLLETFALGEVTRAIEDALRLGAILV